MLGLAKMAPAAWRYYAAHVALGLEDYFTGRGEAPGHWTGSGAAALGLDGEVDPAQLGALFGQGRHPVTGEALGTPWDHRSTDRVAGYSLSLSPPKSVSVLWGLGTPNVAAEVAAAHQAAVAAAVTLLEDHAGFSRAGKAGVFQVDTDGLIVASFVHRTSRAVDPDLHTHLLVSNKVRCADGRWRALDGREVFAMQKPAGSVYQAAIRAELSARLGVEWEPVDRNGQADIVGVPEGLCRMFSTRRRQIEVRGAERVAAAEARLGRSLTDEERAEAFQVATLETRPDKGGIAEATVSLLERWRAMAVGPDGRRSVGWARPSGARRPSAAWPSTPAPTWWPRWWPSWESSAPRGDAPTPSRPWPGVCLPAWWPPPTRPGPGSRPAPMPWSPTARLCAWWRRPAWRSPSPCAGGTDWPPPSATAGPVSPPAPRSPSKGP